MPKKCQGESTPLGRAECHTTYGQDMGEGIVPTLEDNLHQLKTKVEALLAAGRVPMVFMDLDDTLNRHFGAPIEEKAVISLRNLAEAGGLFGLNTGADMFWAGERVLRETDRFFPCPFLLLATGKRIYAWAESLQAYVLLPIRAENKGQAMRKLAEYLDLSLDQFLFIADFPRAGERQEGIDDPVLREPVGVIVNIGLHCAITSAFQETLLLNPERQGNILVGTGYEATVHYLECMTEVLKHESYAEKVKALRAELKRAVERKLNLPVLPNRGYQFWTFEHPLQRVESHQSVLIRVRGAGMVHAGIDRDGKWIRIYDVPLKEISPSVWEASVLDLEVNAFTFIWYDPNGSGNVHWEGKNYLLQRPPGHAALEGQIATCLH
jgi:hypothetical protein